MDLVLRNETKKTTRDWMVCLWIMDPMFSQGGSTDTTNSTYWKRHRAWNSYSNREAKMATATYSRVLTIGLLLISCHEAQRNQGEGENDCK
jgi:hypothetical protein